MALATTSKATLQNARMMCCWEIFLGTPSTTGPPCRHAGNLATLLTEGMNSINGGGQSGRLLSRREHALNISQAKWHDGFMPEGS